MITNSRGLPSSFIYVVLAVGQDPGRTEAAATASFAFNTFTKSLFICESSSAVASLGVSFFSVQLKNEIDTRIDKTNKVKFAFIFSQTPPWYREAENHTNEDAHTDADR